MRTTAGPAERVRASRNILLEQLSDADQALMEPHVEEVTFACGTALFASDQPVEAVFFPGTALVSLDQATAGGRSLEVGVVGREGMLGWSALLGGGEASHSATVRMHPGTLLRVACEPLARACTSSPSLHRALLQFVHVFIAQISRALASSCRDTLDQRLACWLLMRHDRVGGDLLHVQHDEIAASLGVRRASITDSLHVIEGERLVRCTRGRIAMRDRGGLEAFAGAAYGGAEQQYRQLIAPFGKGVAGAGGNERQTLIQPVGVVLA